MSFLLNKELREYAKSEFMLLNKLLDLDIKEVKYNPTNIYDNKFAKILISSPDPLPKLDTVYERALYLNYNSELNNYGAIRKEFAKIGVYIMNTLPNIFLLIIPPFLGNTYYEAFQLNNIEGLYSTMPYTMKVIDEEVIKDDVGFVSSFGTRKSAIEYLLRTSNIKEMVDYMVEHNGFKIIVIETKESTSKDLYHISFIYSILINDLLYLATKQFNELQELKNEAESNLNLYKEAVGKAFSGYITIDSNGFNFPLLHIEELEIPKDNIINFKDGNILRSQFGNLIIMTNPSVHKQCFQRYQCMSGNSYKCRIEDKDRIALYIPPNPKN